MWPVVKSGEGVPRKRKLRTNIVLIDTPILGWRLYAQWGLPCEAQIFGHCFSTIVAIIGDYFPLGGFGR
jgi:hypothetical protein